MSKASLLAELIRRGFPEGTAKKIVSGDLPMDQASRMKRAQEQGYGDPVYHATERDFPAFNKNPQPNLSYGYQDQGLPGSWFTNSKQQASELYGKVPYPPPDHAETGANIIEARLRLNNPVVVEGDATAAPLVRVGAIKRELRKPKAERAGGVVFRRQGTDGGSVDETFVLDPTNIRSTNAAFDPDNVGKNTLLGGLAAGAVLAGQGQKAEAGEIKAPKNPKTLALANGIRALEGKLKGHPAGMLVPTGTADWLYKMAYDQKPNNEDRLKVLMDFL